MAATQLLLCLMYIEEESEAKTDNDNSSWIKGRWSLNMIMSLTEFALVVYIAAQMKIALVATEG